MKVVDEFKNGGEFVYDSSVDSSDVDDLSDPTAFKDTMTVQVYDQYGDAYSGEGVYSETVTWANAWFSDDAASDGTNMKSNGKGENSNYFLWSDTTDNADGRCEVSVDTTKLATGWVATYGTSFTIEIGCGGKDADENDWKTDSIGKTIEVPITVTDISDMDSDYSVSLSGLEGSYDLTRAYEKNESTGEYAWGFANADEDFTGTATATVKLSMLRGGYDGRRDRDARRGSREG